MEPLDTMYKLSKGRLVNTIGKFRNDGMFTLKS
jgi:hypothetical protein